MYENWLRSFHAVASMGGFTAGAKYLNVSQPTVTEQVKLLEEKYSVELFYRQGRKVELTDLGHSLFLVTQNIAGYTNEALELLSTYKQSPGSPFTIGSVSPYDVLRIVNSFQTQFPDVMPRVAVYHRREILQQLLDFNMDIAIIGREEKDKRFFNTPFRCHPVHLLVPANHRWAKRKSIRLAELRNAPMILRESKSTTRAIFSSEMKKAGIPFRVVMEIDNREAIREAVKLGMGYGLASNDGIHGIPTDQLKILKLSDVEMTIQLHLICLSNRRDRLLINAFIDTALTSEKTI